MAPLVEFVKTPSKRTNFQLRGGPEIRFFLANARGSKANSSTSCREFECLRSGSLFDAARKPICGQLNASRDASSDQITGVVAVLLFTFIIRHL